MLFNSIEFVWFLPLVVVFYYLLPVRFRWILLLAASYVFYMFWKVEYVALIVVSTLIDYWAGLQMARWKGPAKRRPYLILSLISNLGLLIAFKYANFFGDSINQLFAADIPALDVLLPVGISFYTFQTLSYSIDVYKGQQEAERHLGYFALYVSFFPQLVAGPIERYARLGPQLRENHSLKYENFAIGFRLMLYGFFAKMAVADNLAPYVNKFYAAPMEFGQADAALSLVFYSFQIYCDFFGYSLIAIGAARLLGVELMDNFRTPYLSSSVAEFWQRWHISLSTWFRDYLFIPIGGSRVNAMRLVLNILIVFLISGLWHGANWTFLLWGAVWGCAYLLEWATKTRLSHGGKGTISIFSILRAVLVFVFATLAWIPFRSDSLGQMKAVMNSLFTPHAATANLDLIWAPLVMLSLFVLSDLALYNRRIESLVASRPLALRWSLYALLIFCVIVFAAVDEFPFIYFRF